MWKVSVYIYLTLDVVCPLLQSFQLWMLLAEKIQEVKINWKLLTVAIASVCSLLYSLYCPSKWSTCLRFLLVSLKKKIWGRKVKTETSSDQTLLLSLLFLVCKSKLITQVLFKGSKYSKFYSSNQNLKMYRAAKGNKKTPKTTNNKKNPNHTIIYSTTVRPWLQIKSFVSFSHSVEKPF